MRRHSLGVGAALVAVVVALAIASRWVLPARALPTPDDVAVPTTTAPPPAAEDDAERASLPEAPVPTTAPRDSREGHPDQPSDRGQATTVSTPERRCPPITGRAAADVDGDGCPDPVRIDGERVTVGPTTWVVGRPGDSLAVADWDCDGRATAASLRHDTGEVFVFDRWVDTGAALTVDASRTVRGAARLVAVDDDGDGCARLTVERAGLPPVWIDIGGQR